MGTLYKQSDRSSYLYNENAEIQDIKTLSDKYGITLQETIDILKFLEMKRANDLYYANGNIHDEQLMGIGELFASFNEKFDFLVTKIMRNYKQSPQSTTNRPGADK